MDTELLPCQQAIILLFSITDNTSLMGIEKDAISSIIEDEGIVTGAGSLNPNNQPLTSPNVSQPKTVYVAQIDPFNDPISQIQSLEPNTVYASAQGSTWQAGGMTYIADGIGGYEIQPDRPIQVVQNPTPDMLKPGQTFTLVSGGGYAIINEDEIPVEWLY